MQFTKVGKQKFDSSVNVMDGTELWERTVIRGEEITNRNEGKVAFEEIKGVSKVKKPYTCKGLKKKKEMNERNSNCAIGCHRCSDVYTKHR